MISYGKQSIDQSDIDAVVEVLKSNWLTDGPAVEIFENDFKHHCGSKHACAVSNGTAALHLTGLALGWQPGDIVITSPITFLATVNCIVYAGATPDFADIDPVTYTIDPNKIEEKVRSFQSKGKNVRAVIGVDYAGHPCDWKSLRDLAVKYDLQLVNDNCHALGASYFGDKQYAAKYADVVIQSFHPVKHITTGEGGSIMTNDPLIDEKVRRLRNHGITKGDSKLKIQHSRLFEPWYYELHDVGYNYRITDFQCALGSSQLKKLDQFVQKRFEIAEMYDRSFSNLNNLIIPKPHNSIKHAYHLYPLQINFEKLPITKPMFFDRMKQVGINLQVHYIPVHLQPFYQQNYGFNSDDFPVSESFYMKEVSLPIYPNISNDDIDMVIDNLLKIIMFA